MCEGGGVCVACFVGTHTTKLHKRTLKPQVEANIACLLVPGLHGCEQLLRLLHQRLARTGGGDWAGSIVCGVCVAGRTGAGRTEAHSWAASAARPPTPGTRCSEGESQKE